MIDTLDIPNPEKTFIKVIGVGGGGGNAVSYMFNNEIEGVDFILMNTDKTALRRSTVPKRILLGKNGLGAGSDPNVGRVAMAREEENIRRLLSDSTEMVFITATLGGGTGTGGAPVVARVAKELGILTIGVVTTPFSFEGPVRKKNAEEGIREMRKYVDSLVIISNDRLVPKGKNPMQKALGLRSSFALSDSILATAARCISDMVVKSGYVNVDMNDVRTVMTDSGDAVIGSAEASASVSGEYRAMQAMRDALTSPLLVNNDIRNAKSVLVNYLYSDKEVTIDELSETMEMIQLKVNDNATIIWGASQVEGLGDKLKISVVVTGQSLAEDKLIGVDQDINSTPTDQIETPKPPVKVTPIHKAPKDSDKVTAVVTNSGENGTSTSASGTDTTTIVKVYEEPVFTPTADRDKPVAKKKLTAMVFDDGQEIDESPAYGRVREVAAERKSEPTSTFSWKINNDDVKMGDNSYLTNRPD
ncbi:MAG: cell division protein FtsZ [Paludibacteraceae bacterium]|nr:cell division protein FtsZ [Paludibacteraceae bacterium]